MISDRVLATRYKLISILGKGGQATVFRVQDLLLKVERAIKLLAPELMIRTESKARFELEAQVMAQINHKGIVRLFDIVRKPLRPRPFSILARRKSIIAHLLLPQKRRVLFYFRNVAFARDSPGKH